MQLRADEALVIAGLCDTLELARALIMEGKALYGSEKLLKPSEKIKQPELLRLKGDNNPYVSRGAYKLKKAFDVFDISCRDKACIDVGASTGGFTEIMLLNGAKSVYSIDVGFNLLDWKIRSDPRVTVMEKTNARLLKPEMFNFAPEFGATDVSFISLKAVLPSVFDVLAVNADFIALIKPQFEARREEVGHKGVVSDITVHERVISEICEFAKSIGKSALSLNYSPVKGPEGNIEFLLHLKNCEAESRITEENISRTVEEAHKKLC